MILRNIGSYILPKVAIAPQSSVAATVNGTGVNRDGYLSAVLHGVTGAVSGAPTTTSVVYKIQHSNDDGSTDAYADADDNQGNALAMAALTAASSDKRMDIDLSGLKKYVRVVATISFTGGTSPAALIFAELTLGGAASLPTDYV